ncbi:MAG: hypothetical protein JWO93_3153 [Micrococcaceae bacterium]|jgi:cell division protein FtsL|nr:hypothetical protein [Micrococcaceae bacterium]
MSVAPSTYQAILGNTARTLPVGGSSPAERQGTKVRTPLALVVSTPRRRRAPFVVVCFLALVAALMTVLVLNISVSSGQYQLVQLRAEQADLMKTNQDLTQQVQNAQAPQNLVAKASELGMVVSTSMGQIDLGSRTVSGNPQPATAGDKPLATIAAPAVGADQAGGGSAASSSTANSSKAGGSASGVPATAGAQQSSASAADLNGGTVPAPKQKNG